MSTERPIATPQPAGYDADVIVVGAGPAGLAAATRVRWVKGYHAMAASVRIIESGAVGGLAALLLLTPALPQRR